MEKPKFEGGVNIALKIPQGKYAQTLDFYQNVLGFGLEEVDMKNHPTVSRSHRCQFGSNTLWLDCVPNYTHSEAWLELKVNDMETATAHLKANGIDTCDELEDIPETNHWVMDPAGTVFILDQSKNS